LISVQKVTGAFDLEGLRGGDRWDFVLPSDKVSPIVSIDGLDGQTEINRAGRSRQRMVVTQAQREVKFQGNLQHRNAARPDETTTCPVTPSNQTLPSLLTAKTKRRRSTQQWPSCPPIDKSPFNAAVAIVPTD
jgi:hypothetical protein